LRRVCVSLTFCLVCDAGRDFPEEETAETFFRRLRNAVFIVLTSTCLIKYHTESDTVNGRGCASTRNSPS